MTKQEAIFEQSVHDAVIRAVTEISGDVKALLEDALSRESNDTARSMLRSMQPQRFLCIIHNTVLLSDHLFGMEYLIKPFRTQKAQLQAGFPQGAAVVIRLFRHLGGIFIANVRVQRCYQH